jgi:alkylated DNA nucleotide flippase Atl1
LIASRAGKNLFLPVHKLTHKTTTSMKKRSASQSAFFNVRVLIGFTLSSLGVFLALIGLSLNSSTPAKAAGTAGQVTVIHPDYADISKPLRDYPGWPQIDRSAQKEGPENPQILIPHTDRPDTVVQHQSLLGKLAPSIPPPILNFDGIPDVNSFCGCEPPDTNGEVGATQYVQMVNLAYQVFDKNTGASILGPNSIESIWTGMPGTCLTGGQGDPVVIYDQLANRWVISQFAGGLTHECVAVSTTSDATGSYARYDYNLVSIGGSALYDYPKISMWPDAYYMSMNVFNTSGTLYLGTQAFAMNRTKMLAGDPSAEIQGPPRLNSSNPPLQPVDLDGSTLPPAGAPANFLLWPDTNTYRVYHFHVDFSNPANTTFTLFGSSPAAPFTVMCPGNRSCIPQKGTTARLDAIGDRLMFRSTYRNFGDHESIVGNYTVSVSGIAGIRWFELRGVTAGPVSTFQEGTYSPDSTHRWMGSIAMDKQGNMLLGFSASDANIFPQIRYTGRLVTDPLGTMPQGEAHLFDGTGSQNDNSFFRWGDYSDMTVDPVDDQTFWYTQEYYATTSSFNWRTRIGNTKLGTSSTLQLLSAASRLKHAAAGTFDIPMPLTGQSGVEDRKSKSYKAVFTFSDNVTSGDVTVIGGTATVAGTSASGHELTAQLNNVADQQTVTLRVSNVNGDGQQHGDVPFSFLIGDVNGNRSVDKPDSDEVRANQGQTVDSSNFRDDLNVNGSIEQNDSKIVKQNKGHHL